MSTIEINDVAKTFGDVTAVAPLDLKVGDGEFLTLLGPSGCGKTTLMRMIAGITLPDRGSIKIAGRDVAALPPERRNVGLVFQSYALFPHMTVGANVGFGLKMRRVSKAETTERVRAALALVDLEPLAARFPRELSGGQQQRVALARAIVIEPDVLLLDEPLSNLDAKLREQLREDLRVLQQRLRVTAIYVTHDQAEAMALADRIIVMRAGKVVEEGAPVALYRAPRTRFAAEFLGQTNVIEITTSGTLPWGDAVRAPAGAVVSIRPEDVILRPDEQGAGRVLGLSFQGATVEYRVDLGGTEVRARDTGTGAPILPEGTTVAVRLNAEPHRLSDAPVRRLVSVP
jgi:putative spermidine/putrescine transport system ATP-binding protein